jgi:hypothetical protein
MSRVRIETVERRDLTPGRLAALHALSNRLMAEDEGHFRVHAETNDLVHVFERTDTGAIVGFQFWRTLPMDLPGCRAIVGGKLRIQPEFRGQALHLRSGLRFYAENKLRHPLARYYRLSVASLFGFTSITGALAEYRIFDPRPADAEGHAIKAAFLTAARDSHFSVDEETGLFLVNIFMTPETVAAYPPSYFDKPAARIYARVNPGYRTNGAYVGFWFLFSPRNLLALGRAVARTVHWPALGALGSQR